MHRKIISCFLGHYRHLDSWVNITTTEPAVLVSVSGTFVFQIHVVAGAEGKLET